MFRPCYISPSLCDLRFSSPYSSPPWVFPAFLSVLWSCEYIMLYKDWTSRRTAIPLSGIKVWRQIILSLNQTLKRLHPVEYSYALTAFILQGTICLDTVTASCRLPSRLEDNEPIIVWWNQLSLQLVEVSAALCMHSYWCNGFDRKMMKMLTLSRVSKPFKYI